MATGWLVVVSTNPEWDIRLVPTVVAGLDPVSWPFRDREPSASVVETAPLFAVEVCDTLAEVLQRSRQLTRLCSSELTH